MKDLDQIENNLNQKLVEAVKKGNISEILDLIKKGADVNYRKTAADSSPLILAVQGKNQDVVRILIDKEAYINNVTSKNVRSAVMSAVALLVSPILLMLIEKGGNVNQDQIDREGKRSSLLEISTSLPHKIKLDDTYSKINRQISEMIVFYTEISKEVLRIIDDSKNDLFQIAELINPLQKKVSEQKFTLTQIVKNQDNKDKKVQEIECQTSKLDLWKMPLNHQGQNALQILSKEFQKLIIQNNWSKIDFLETKGININSITDSKGVSISQKRNLHQNALDVLCKIFPGDLGLLKFLSEFLDVKDRYNLAIVSKPKTSPQTVEAKKLLKQNDEKSLDI